MRLLKNTWKNRTLFLMSLPCIILMIMFNYVPMTGLVLAFKKFNFADGMYLSPWVGFDNFKVLFHTGNIAQRLFGNTILYYIIFTITGTIGNVMLAIGINEMVFKRAAKYMQSCMILPTFISYIAVSFIVYALLASKTGMINQLIVAAGGKSISFYTKPEYWPLILTLVKIWKGTGYGSVMYLATLAGIDPNMYEAAEIDGANARQKMWYITIPSLIPMIVVMTLLGLGHFMHSDTGLFYQVTRNSGMLYKTTQVLDSYILNNVMNASDFGLTGAVSFFQSTVGCIMVVVTNLIVRRSSPESALF